MLILRAETVFFPLIISNPHLLMLVLWAPRLHPVLQHNVRVLRTASIKCALEYVVKNLAIFACAIYRRSSNMHNDPYHIAWVLMHFNCLHHLQEIKHYARPLAHCVGLPCMSAAIISHLQLHSIGTTLTSTAPTAPAARTCWRPPV